MLGLARLARHERVAAAAERLPPALDRFVRPRRHRARQAVEAALDDPALLARFERGERLPPRYGVGLDERVVEYPWLVSRRPRGRTLDAGSVLNHRGVLTRVRPLLDDLHIVTLEPERRSYPHLGVSYAYADLRELPYRDGWFDTVVCVSTLEHVGMDNSGYGSGAPRSADPAGEVAAAARELRRVVAPGGRLLITVPFGDPEDLGWLRQFTEADVQALIDTVAPARKAITVFTYSREGWDVGDAACGGGRPLPHAGHGAGARGPGLARTRGRVPRARCRPVSEPALSRPRRFARAAHRTTWGLADQVLLSATNFAAIVIMARSVEADAFGAFVVAYTALLIANGVQTGLVAQPHNVLGQRIDGAEYRAYTTTLAAAQLVLAAAPSRPRPGGRRSRRGRRADYAGMVLALAPAAFAWQLAEFVRRVLYTEDRIRTAFTTDVLAYGGQLAALTRSACPGV